MNLTLPQVLLIVFDTFIEAIWPLSLMITLNSEGTYSYDPIVMQAIACFFAFFISICIDSHRQNWAVPSLLIGWSRFFNGFFAVCFLSTGVILLTAAFRMASSGAAATIGFLSLPIYIIIELTHGVLCKRYDKNELNSIQKKLAGITPEILLIITTCATLFALQDSASSIQGILLLLSGRCLICIKSYVNGRNGEAKDRGNTVSNATAFLLMNAVLKYALSQPSNYILESKEAASWSNLIPHGWNWLTFVAWFADSMICISNILVETCVGGEMQAITGMSGRIIGMYISFAYDVTPTCPIVLAVLSMSWAVIAYMRLHYRFGTHDPTTEMKPYVNMAEAKLPTSKFIISFWQTY